MSHVVEMVTLLANIAELYMRPLLFERLREDDLAPIRSIAASPETDTEARSFLLESAMRFPQPLQGAWLGEIAREIVEGAQPDLNLNSTWPLLIKTSLQVLEAHGDSSDATLIARYFGSNSPGVAKAALSALQAIELEAAASRAREVLDRGGLHQTTQQAMERFLEQYEKGQSG